MVYHCVFKTSKTFDPSSCLVHQQHGQIGRYQTSTLAFTFYNFFNVFDTLFTSLDVLLVVFFLKHTFVLCIVLMVLIIIVCPFYSFITRITFAGIMSHVASHVTCLSRWWWWWWWWRRLLLLSVQAASHFLHRTCVLCSPLIPTGVNDRRCVAHGPQRSPAPAPLPRWHRERQVALRRLVPNRVSKPNLSLRVCCCRFQPNTLTIDTDTRHYSSTVEVCWQILHKVTGQTLQFPWGC